MSIRFEAEGIHSFELQALDASPLPPFTAGAHIELRLANGLQRSYSLLNSQNERHRYVIAISRDPKSRGGSRFIHDQLRVGQEVRISAPRNNFVLAEDARHTVLVSGGIGITPLLGMIARLESLDRSWELFYCARSRRCAAFLGQLEHRYAASDRLRVHLDDEMGAVFDVASALQDAPADAHVYCCGPTPMLDAFLAAAAQRPSSHVHVEYFTARESPAREGGFYVMLLKSQQELYVDAGQTILQTVLDAGVDASYSCMEGICGACETRVVEGVPEHRDVVLTQEERDSNRSMMICCSGCRGERLVLDL